MQRNGAGWVDFSALILVNIMWAAQYPAYKIASDHMGVAALNFWVLLFAIVLLLPFELRSRRSRPRRRFTRRSIYEFFLLGLLGIIPPSVFLAWGINHSSASNASILSLAVPILMTTLGIIMLSEKITPIRVLSLMIGIAGTVLISAADFTQSSFGQNVLVGNIVILFAEVGSAFYNVYGKDLLSRYSEIEVLLYSYAVALIGCAVLSIATDVKPFYAFTGYGFATWASILVLGGLSWGIAMVLWMWVLNRLDVGQVSVSIYLLPFFGLLLSMITVHERISIWQIAGGALVLLGTALLTVYDQRRGVAPAIE